MHNGHGSTSPTTIVVRAVDTILPIRVPGRSDGNMDGVLCPPVTKIKILQVDTGNRNWPLIRIEKVAS